jgi:uncharacterized membrane protein YhaH (DUF805 family)
MVLVGSFGASCWRILLIYLFVQEGDMGENMFGSVPTNMLE